MGGMTPIDRGSSALDRANSTGPDVAFGAVAQIEPPGWIEIELVLGR